MSNQPNNVRFAIKDIDLTESSATAQYPVGLEVEQIVEAGRAITFKYVKSHALLTINQLYVYDFDGTDYITAAPVTNAAQVVRVGVPQAAIASGEFGFVAIKGQLEALHIAETYAAGDHLEILNAGTSLVVDGSTGSTVKTESSVGVTVDAGTTAAAFTVELYGVPVVVAAA